jgi:hypothetical protein
MFEAIAAPQRSRLWDPSDVADAADVLAESGVVGWNEPYESEGKARGAGTALARLLLDLPGNKYEGFRVSVFERADDPENGVEGGFYWSVKPKAEAEPENLVDPSKHNRNDLLKMASEANVTVAEKATKAEIAKAINATATVTPE